MNITLAAINFTIDTSICDRGDRCVSEGEMGKVCLLKTDRRSGMVLCLLWMKKT